MRLASKTSAGVRAQLIGTVLVAVASFGLLFALQRGQRVVRARASSALADFRTARLDVANGFAHVLGEGIADAPFDRHQGLALLAQGVDELSGSAVECSAEDRGALRDALSGVSRALEPLRADGADGARLVALRLAVVRLELVAGRVDADAEVALVRTTRRQDVLFDATLGASCVLLAALSLVLWRSLRGAEAAEAARDEATALLRAVVEGTTDAVFVKDLQGRYRLLNDAAARVFGRAPDEVLGRDDRALWDEPNVSTILEHDGRVLRSGAPSTLEETLTVDGRRRVFLTSKYPRRDARGVVAGVIGIARDITERLVLEERVRQSQKMEAIGRLAGGVAHDFNNVLTVINASAELLCAGGEGEAEREENVEAIRDAGRRAAALTAQLLAFSRKAVVTPRTIDLNQAVLSAERLLQRILGEDITLSSTLSPTPCVVEVDPSQLDQVLMNLGVNARDAMPRGGTLALSTAAATVESGEHAGRWAELRVADSGAGMDGATRAHIFEPFFTTKGVGKGTGLGLSVVDGIVAQAGGHIEVESEVGVGTTFLVRLPIVARRDASERPRPAQRGAGGRETVLVAEDDDGVRRLVRSSLESLGYRVLAARDGESALAAARSHDGPIHLLVTDVVMPHVSGREVVDRLRATRPPIRVLFLSGYADDAMVRHGVAAGDEPFLAKPFTTQQLARAVRGALDGTPSTACADGA
ncbi:MAG: PAS domain-containing protein [Polyangiales bacterium]